MEMVMQKNFTFDAVKVKIEKLLRLSTSPNEFEAASALAKSQALMEEYNLSMAEIILDDRQTNSLSIVKETLGTDVEDWERALANGIAKIFGVKMFAQREYERVHRRRSTRKSIVFYGLPMDVSTTKDCFVMIQEMIQIRSIAEFALAKLAGIIGHSRGATLAYKRGWFDGCITRIINRVKENRDYELGQGNKMTALVVRKEELISQKMKADGIHLVNIPSSARSSVDGFHRGASAANSIALNKLVN